MNGATAAEYRVVIAAPKNNRLRAFAGEPGVERVFATGTEMTQDALAAYVDDPNVLFVFDDCQLLKDIPASNWLQSLIGALDSDKAGFVVAGDAGEFPVGFGNWGAAVKKIRQGVLLKPDDLVYQDLINMKIKRSLLTSQAPAGRGFIHIGRMQAMMQVASS